MQRVSSLNDQLPEHVTPQSNNMVISIGFFILICFAFSRPIVSALETRSGFPFHIIIPLFFSYLLFFHLLIVLKLVKQDKVSILIAAFCFYTLFSIAWGSDFKESSRFIMPFVCLFSVRTIITDSSRLRILIASLIIGYSFTIIPSTLLIISGSSIQKVDYFSGVSRQIGAYVGAHSLGHAMVFFSFIYVLFLSSGYVSKTILKFLLHFLFLASVYCLWNSYVRSAYIGFFVFWASYLMIYRKRYFIIFLLFFSIFFLWKFSTFMTIFWKRPGFSLDAASSGRLTLWTHNLFLFLDLPFYIKLLGSGLGSEAKNVVGTASQIWSSHNDYITLLMTEGIFGLFLYLWIILALIKDIIFSNINKQIKAIFLASILSILTTSMLTNAFIVRFEMSQLFWLFVGCFYCYQTIYLNHTNRS